MAQHTVIKRERRKGGIQKEKVEREREKDSCSVAGFMAELGQIVF
jgi:hypothetical protein